MRHTIRVTCPVCEGAGDLTDEDGVYLCGNCLGHGWKDETAPAPACDVESHDQAVPFTEEPKL